MFAPVVHFELTKVQVSTKHREYKEWRFLSYQPELLLQSGVVWGDTWARSPDCANIVRQDSTDADLDFDYGSLFWLREPLDQTIREFRDFAERSFHMGRRPDSAWATEVMSGFLVPLKGYVNPRALVSAHALPCRPATGIHLSISRFTKHDAEVESYFRWYDQVRIPDLLECAGAVGAWTFATKDLFKPNRDLSNPALRLQVIYLDGNPLAFSADMEKRRAGWKLQGRDLDTSSVERTLFAGALRSIVPWRWNWFDGAPTASTAQQP